MQALSGIPAAPATRENVPGSRRKVVVTDHGRGVGVGAGIVTAGTLGINAIVTP